MICSCRLGPSPAGRVARFAGLIAALLAIALPARARETYFDYGNYMSAEDALELPDLRFSRVVYSELGCPSHPLWLKLEGSKGDVLRVRLAVPALRALASERPSLALLGPGVPRAGWFPFEVPPGLGAQVFTTEGVRRPRLLRERDLRAASWLLLEERIPLPEDGTYHLVAWSPAGRRARLWVATGEAETEPWSNVDDPAERLEAFFSPVSAPDLGVTCPSRLWRPARAMPAEPGGCELSSGCAHVAGSAGGAAPAAAAALALGVSARVRRRPRSLRR
jgi:MYXO-CTERM domain-containing protein